MPKSLIFEITSDRDAEIKKLSEFDGRLQNFLLFSQANCFFGTMTKTNLDLMLSGHPFTVILTHWNNFGKVEILPVEEYGEKVRVEDASRITLLFEDPKFSHVYMKSIYNKVIN